tara:strand:+ start:583 stop:1107 length:525 start_codon:yes stop_codon:yes gene_type:complete
MNKQEVTTFCNKLIPDIENHVRTWNLKGCSEFYLGKTILDFSPRRRSSRGGLYTVKSVKVPGINLAVLPYTNKPEGIYRWYEYKSFDSNSLIGGFYADNQELNISALICHEISHAIQFWIYWYNNTERPKPHGQEFKDYYKTLRNKYVNKKLPNQIEYKAQYEAEIAKFTLLKT